MTHFCLSVDVEEDLPGILPRGTRGIEEGLPRLLEILDDVGICGDFFFLASVAKEYPDFLREVAKKGHGIGNHGLDHADLCQKPIERQREEIRLSTRILENLEGATPVVFRAPNFSADASTFALLGEEGYLIDSSVLPGRVLKRRLRTVYDHRRAPVGPYYPGLPNPVNRGRLLEIPVTPNPRQPGAPLGQGALNVYGPQVLLDTARSMNLGVLVFLIHPWELVDLASFYPSLPSGYAAACSGDLSPLHEFLVEATKEFSATTLGGYLKSQCGA